MKYNDVVMFLSRAEISAMRPTFGLTRTRRGSFWGHISFHKFPYERDKKLFSLKGQDYEKVLDDLVQNILDELEKIARKK